MADQEIKRIKFPLEVVADIEFDSEDIATKLAPLQVADLIIELDNEVGDWEHSLLLYHHFAAQYEVAKAHAPDLAAMTPDQLRESMSKTDEEASDAG